MVKFENCKSYSTYFLTILGFNQWLMLTYFPYNILLISTVADLSLFRRLKNKFLNVRTYVHTMYIWFEYLCLANTNTKKIKATATFYDFCVLRNF